MEQSIKEEKDCDPRLGLLFRSDLFPELRGEILDRCTDRSLATLVQLNKAWKEYTCKHLGARLTYGISFEKRHEHFNYTPSESHTEPCLVWTGRFMCYVVQLLNGVLDVFEVRWMPESYRAPIACSGSLAFYQPTCKRDKQEPLVTVYYAKNRQFEDAVDLTPFCFDRSPLRARVRRDIMPHCRLDEIRLERSWCTIAGDLHCYTLGGLDISRERHEHLLSMSPRYREFFNGQYSGNVLQWRRGIVNIIMNGVMSEDEPNVLLFFIDDADAVDYELKRMLALWQRHNPQL